MSSIASVSLYNSKIFTLNCIMPRKAKTGLDHFPFDTDLFSDIKVRKLIKYQSAKAIAVYAYLLCIIYRDGYYMKWDNALPFIISECLGFDEAFVGEAIECMVRLGLFNEHMFREKQVLTARGIQERYLRELARLRRTGDVSEYSLLDSPHLTAMLNSTLWLAKMRQDHKLSADELNDLLNEWSKWCAATDKQHTSAQDAKRHFENWYKKINQQKQQSNATKPTTDRRRAARQLTATAQDYKTSF